MATEFFAEGGREVAIRLTPGSAGILQVYANGDKIFDRKDENDEHPNLPRVKEMRAAIREKLAAAVVADTE